MQAGHYDQCKAAKKNLEATKKPRPPSPHLPTLSEYFFPKPPLNTPAEKLPDCLPVEKALFVRSDSLDNFNYAASLPTGSSGSSGSSSDPGNSDQPGSGQSPNAKAKGLSISYTDNMQANTQTATINGRISYLLIGGHCGLLGDGTEAVPNFFGFAPFISSNGTWNEPSTATTTGTTSAGKTITITTTKTSTSALRFGADFEFGSSMPQNYLQWRQNYFYASPFYQTDYRGLAQIGGVNLAWEPYVHNLFYLNDGTANPDFSYITQFRAEAEFTRVDNAGLTKLVKGDHAWFGETARPNLTLFPAFSDDSTSEGSEWFNTWIRGRISLIGTQQFYWDADTGKTAPNYSAQLQYKLGECRVALNKPAGTPCSVSGSSSISFQYDWGRNKDTYVKSNQILVTLGYSY